MTAREPQLLARRRARHRAGAAALRARGRRGARAQRHAGVRRRELERHRDRLDLRRPRHVQEVQGAGASRASVPVSSVDPRAFTPDELRDGWRLACRAPGARRAGDRGAAAADAAEGGAGRRRPPRDPAAVGAEAPPRARRADDGGPALGLRARAGRARGPRAARRAAACCATLGRVLRRANWDVTAVVCDDVLIDVEPGDTTARRFAIAFDLGTTTVVATLLDLETGTPAAVRSMLNRQQPFGADVITRICATMMDEGALDALQAARAGDARAAHRGGLRGGARRSRRGLRDHALRQRDDDAARARHRPRAALDGAVRRHDARPAAARCAADFGVPVHPRAPAFAFPSLGAYVGGDIVAGHARHRADARQAAAAVHRRRHELGDRARQPGRRRRHRRARRPGVRGGADPLRHARRRRRDRGRARSPTASSRSR